MFAVTATGTSEQHATPIRIFGQLPWKVQRKLVRGVTSSGAKMSTKLSPGVVRTMAYLTPSSKAAVGIPLVHHPLR